MSMTLWFVGLLVFSAVNTQKHYRGDMNTVGQFVSNLFFATTLLGGYGLIFLYVGYQVGAIVANWLELRRDQFGLTTGLILTAVYAVTAALGNAL